MFCNVEAAVYNEGWEGVELLEGRRVWFMKELLSHGILLYSRGEALSRRYRPPLPNSRAIAYSTFQGCYCAQEVPSVGANKTRVRIAAFTCPGFCPGFCPYLPERSYSVIVIIATHRYCHVGNERR